MTQLSDARIGSFGYLGIGVSDMDAWKDFAGKNASCAELLRLAEQVQ